MYYFYFAQSNFDISVASDFSDNRQFLDQASEPQNV